MDSTTLSNYRDDLYRCFTSRGDAVFELSDALLSYPTAHSFVELSEAGCMKRRWWSLYQALAEGRIDEDRLVGVWSRYTPKTRERVVLGLDTVPVHRPLAHTYRDRTWVHVPNLPPSTRPVKPGWEFSTLGSLPSNPCSHVYWLDGPTPVWWTLGDWVYRTWERSSRWGRQDRHTRRSSGKRRCGSRVVAASPSRR